MNIVSTVFSQLLRFVPKPTVDALAAAHRGPRAERKFSRWDQLIHLLHIQLAGLKSLRDGVTNLKLYKKDLHLLRTRPVPRSTFADANRVRPYTFFEELAGQLYSQCLKLAPKHKMPFKCKIFSLDATTISLNLKVFPWAEFRKVKGGVKVHTLLDLDGNIPQQATVTEAKHHECKIARFLGLPKDSIITFDRGFISYIWLCKLMTKGIHFVTRLKANADYAIKAKYQADPDNGILINQLISVGPKYELLTLRHVRYKNPEDGHEYDFISSLITAPAKHIADIYKERWKVETFFRFIKQNLKIQTFVGTSRNAVLSQIYVALIAYILAAWQKFLSKTKASIGMVIRLIKNHIFDRRVIDELWNPPEEPKIITMRQYTLIF